MSNRRLLVEVQSGLCNRLRVYLSAKFLAEESDRRLQVVWTPASGCGAHWRDLFTNPIDEIGALPPEPPALDGRVGVLMEQAARSSADVVCVRSCCFLLPYRNWTKVMASFRELEPVDVVAQMVRMKIIEFQPETIGVHVRRGDFALYLPTKKNAKLPALKHYFAHLDRWRGSIFLSTDGGDEVEQPFRKRYGKRLIIHPKRSRDRGTVEAVQDALADLYLLQRCCALVGTEHSSFTRTATIFGTHYVTVGEPLGPPTVTSHCQEPHPRDAA